MSDLLPFLITGLVTGTVYGLAGTGLVLTFKTSGIFNFGHGAVLTAGCLVFYWMHITLGWDWKIATAITVLGVAPLLGLLLERVARDLARQRTPMKVVGTVGFTVLVPALCVVFYPLSQGALRVDRFMPFADRREYRYRIFGLNVFGDQFLIVAISVVLVGALFALFRFTRLGTSMRAVVDDPELLALQGTSPNAVRRLAWIIGSMFATISGLLLLPSVGLQPYTLVFLATYAFGAAALSGFSGIAVTFFGGIAIGMGQDVLSYLVRQREWASLNGLPDALPFLILFVVLLAMPKHKLSPRSEAEVRPPLQWRGPIELRLTAGVVVVALLCLVPLFAGTKQAYFTFGLCGAILVLSLGLLMRTGGQVSLCHATFAAIGGVTFSRFTVEGGLPWLVALVLAALVVVPIGAIVALPAIRLHGVYLALATFGFGILMTRLVFPQNWMFFTFSGGRPVPTPFGSNSPATRYYVVLAVFIVCALVVLAISNSRLGRLLRGMSGSQVAVSTLGLSTNVTKIIVFCISAFIAAIGGIMYSMTYTTIDSNTIVFQPYHSLVLVVLVALAPFREPWYAVFAAITAVIPGLFDGPRAFHILNALFGLFAVLIAVRGGHPAMSPHLRHVFGRFKLKRGQETKVKEPVATSPPRVVSADGDGLRVEGLSVRFGGLLAVDNASLQAKPGTITGLIGPNGAGKTTTFNACSGLNRNVVGRITLNGSEISSLGSPARARRGIGRTFQRMELCDELTVFDNVALGQECSSAGARTLGQMVASKREYADMLEASARALELCGVSQLADEQAGALSTGQRRLVELARCLAGPFDLLLLDEPSSGLDREETIRFGEVLTRVVEDRGCGILLVEHDMSLVMSVCSYLYVLDFGRLVFEGTPSEVAASEIVRAAYLGTEAVVVGAQNAVPENSGDAR